MTPDQLLYELTVEGFTLRVADDARLVVTPGSRLSARQRGLVGEHRVGLIALIAPLVTPWEEEGVWPPTRSTSPTSPPR